MATEETFLVLGGGGMIGRQVVHEVASDLKPRWVLVCSLFQKEVRETIDHFKREFPHVHFIGFWGDLFLRTEWNSTERQHQMNRGQLLDSDERRHALYEDLYGDLEDAYERSQLVKLILEHKPDVIVDTVNTATAISYQDVYTASATARKRMDSLLGEVRKHRSSPEDGAHGGRGEIEEIANLLQPAAHAVDRLLIAQSVPQLIRHVLLLHRAMTEAGTRLYLKVGTTGTGGMGLNIPYTHSEDKPSVTLMTKTSIAFAHTGLMFLMARTPGGPVVKEIKPGAMVGYADVTCRTIHEHGKNGKPVYVFEGKTEPLGQTLELREPEAGYKRLDKLQMVVVDTGENGVFTGGEFETITHLGQMEFITPEEIAHEAVLEIKGSNTGRDVIAAIDSAVMNPTYRAGYLRHFVLEQVEKLENQSRPPSVALGQLGPPELGKLLWEAYLLRARYCYLEAVVQEPAEHLSAELAALIQADRELQQTIVSVGLPILMPDGYTLVRGPYIRIPESRTSTEVEVTPENIDAWAAKGWVDLRLSNMDLWRERFKRMQRANHRLRGRGSAAVTGEAYMSEEIQIGAVVGWVINNEIGGYRIK